MDETKVYFELIVISVFINIPLSYCSNVNESVVCDGGYVLIESHNQCAKAKRLGELCSFSQQCQYFDDNTYCDEKWICNVKCKNGQELNPKIGLCLTKLNKTFEMALREFAVNLRQKNSSQNSSSNKSRTINLFSLLHSTSNNNGVCPFDNRWNKYTQSCEINPFLVNSGTLLLSFGFAIAFIFIILMVYRKRQSESINLFQTLNAFNISNNQTLGLREPVVYFVPVPNEDGASGEPPPYQEVVNNNPNNCKLPSYEEAMSIPAATTNQ